MIIIRRRVWGKTVTKGAKIFPPKNKLWLAITETFFFLRFPGHVLSEFWLCFEIVSVRRQFLCLFFLQGSACESPVDCPGKALLWLSRDRDILPLLWFDRWSIHLIHRRRRFFAFLNAVARFSNFAGSPEEQFCISTPWSPHIFQASNEISRFL